MRRLCAMRCPGSATQHSRQACTPSATRPVLALSGGLPLSRHTGALCAVRRLRHRRPGNVRPHAPLMGNGMRLVLALLSLLKP